jgi:SmpA / OmlA family
MAKFSRDDDDRDEMPRRDKGGGNTALVVLAVVGALVLACGGVGVAFFVLSVRTARVAEQQAEAEVRAEADARRAGEVERGARLTTDGSAAVRSREQWRKLLAGKSKDQVLQTMGQPARRSEGPESWTYQNRSRDPVSDTIDPTMVIYFDESGTVERVEF